MSQLTLFVIIDPTRTDQPALVRAADIAGVSGGHVHAFCAVHEEDISAYSSRRDAKYQLRQQAKDRISALLEPLASEHISVSQEVVWNERWYEYAVHACAKLGADVLIKSTFKHDKGFAKLRKRSDYHLMRYSPCPVLLTQSPESCEYKRVLAAVAIEDGENRHDELNNLVIAQSRRICRLTGAELHVVAALDDDPDIAQLLDIMIDEDEQKLSSEELIHRRFGVDIDKVHIDFAPAKEVILDTAKKLECELLVLGTVARKGISGAILGNTCEKVLDLSSIDVLTVN
jgi:universal stress protein E